MAPGYTTVGVKNDRRSPAVAVLEREIVSHFKSGPYNENDMYLDPAYGLYAAKQRWRIHSNVGLGQHARVGHCSVGVYSHYAPGTIAALLEAYGGAPYNLDPPAFILAQPKILGVQNLDGAERYEMTGTLINGEDETFDVTIPEGTDEDTPVFIGGLKLKIDSRTAQYPFRERYRFYNDVPTAKPKPGPPSDATGTADGGTTFWISDAERTEPPGYWVDAWLRVTEGTNYGTDAVQVTSSSPGVVQWSPADAFLLACDDTTRYVLGFYPSSWNCEFDEPYLVNHRLGVAVRNAECAKEQVQIGIGPRHPHLSSAFPSNIFLVYDLQGDVKQMIRRTHSDFVAGGTPQQAGWDRPRDLVTDGLSSEPYLHHMHDGRSILMLERGNQIVEVVSTQEGAAGSETR